MELKHIKDLMAAMGRTGTKSLTLKKKDFELTLERESTYIEHSASPQHRLDDTHFYAQTWQRTDQALSKGSELVSPRFHVHQAHEHTQDTSQSGSFVTSPMVGTFYNASSPDVAPYIKIGDKVDKNDVVCIIEAMKVMNEVKAGVSGTVVEILVDTNQPVEFGSKLFRIVE